MRHLLPSSRPGPRQPRTGLFAALPASFAAMPEAEREAYCLDMAAAWSDDGITALHLATILRAVCDATTRRTVKHDSSGTSAKERDDARDFLRDASRLGDVCEALGVNVEWVQGQLRRAYPQVWEGK